MKTLVLQVLKTGLPLALGIYLIWVFFNGMSDEALQYFYAALRQANYWWILSALVLTFAAYAARAYRWKFALEPMGYTTSFWNRYHAVMIGYLINLTIPRAGEASRSAMLLRAEQVPFSKSFGTIIAERAVDLVMMGSIALSTFYLASDHSNAILAQIKTRFSPNAQQQNYTGTLVYILVGVLLIFLILLVIKANWRKAVIKFFGDVLAGILSIFKSKSPLAYLGYTFLIWGLYIVFFWIAFFCLEATAHLSMEAILMAFLAGGIGIVFTNGGIGMFPLLVGLVVEFYLGKDEPNALAIGNAIGMLIWVSQTIFLILAGLISLFLITRQNPKKDVTA